jgi:hypothetical protein
MDSVDSNEYQFNLETDEFAILPGNAPKKIAKNHEFLIKLLEIRVKAAVAADATSTKLLLSAIFASAFNWLIAAKASAGLSESKLHLFSPENTLN